MGPQTIEEVQAAVRERPRVLPRGGGTKTGLSSPAEGVAGIDLSGLCGVAEYEPGEFTITALAGTRVADAAAALRQHGQYLPFDPILAAKGATLGGTVAAGTSGPGSYRYGRIRDFLIGIRFVDGEGNLVRSGGKVVKNAAGFDFSKLMVGSLGRLGILVELTFKVFPEPPAYTTIRAECLSLSEALDRLAAVGKAQIDLHALDVAPGPGSVTLWARLGGLAGALPGRTARLHAAIGGEALPGADEAEVWRRSVEMAWVPEGWALVKIPVTVGRIAALEAGILGLPAGQPGPGTESRNGGAGGSAVLTRYSAGGQVAWLAVEPGRLGGLDALLREQGLAGLAVLAPQGRLPGGRARLGVRIGESFERRVRQALDPAGRFVES